MNFRLGRKTNPNFVPRPLCGETCGALANPGWHMTKFSEIFRKSITEIKYSII